MILSLQEQEAKAARMREKLRQLDIRKATRRFERKNVGAEKRRKRIKEGARLIALDKIQGMTLAELSAKYRLSPDKIRKKLDYVAQCGMIGKQTEAVINVLVPQALAVYDLTLSDLYHEVNKTVVDVATRVLEGTGVLNRERALQGPPPEDGAITTIEEYRAFRLTRIKEETSADSGHGTSGRGTVLDHDQADARGDVDGQFIELPEGGNGGSQDPAGGHPQDQGCD